MWVLFQTELNLVSMVGGSRPTTPYKAVAGIQATDVEDAFRNHNTGICIVWEAEDCRTASVGDILVSPEGCPYYIKSFGVEPIEDIPGVRNMALCL